MKITYVQDFHDGFRILSRHDKDAVLGAIALFQEYPFDPSLENHALRKPLSGKYAISATSDIRIIFREKGGYAEVIMLDVGTHERVYYNR